MSSTRGVRWLMCVVVTPAMSAATADTCAELLVPAAVDRLAGQRERGHRRGDEPLGAIAVRACVVGDAPGLGDERGVEKLPLGDESLDAAAQFGWEEARVRGGQHRGEHPERVASQLVCPRSAGTRWTPPAPATPRRAGRRSRPDTCRTRRTGRRRRPTPVGCRPGSRRDVRRSPAQRCRPVSRFTSALTSTRVV